MSGKQAAQASHRQPPANRNIKKLRASMVCSLTSSWQHWAKENEEKQASEPSGWSPSSLGEPTEKPRQTRTLKKKPLDLAESTDSNNHVTHPGEAQQFATPHEETFETSDELLVASPIKVRQVVKTVTSGVQEKGAGVGLLAGKINRESLPSNEEIDRLLKKTSSPTRRRKCSNMVSSLTKSWRQVEKGQEHGKQGEPHGGYGYVGDEDNGGHPEGKKNTLSIEETQAHGRSSVKETEDKDSDSEAAVKIKRSTVQRYKEEAGDASKIKALSKKNSAVGNLKSRWQTWASEHTVNQKLNPFSESFDYDYSMSLRIQKGQEGYGRPKEGTKTAERAQRAEKHIHREIDDMCYVIRTMAHPGPDGQNRITFGELFERYVRISDKVVGILMRARKHGKVAFDGEMLWQGQDDGVIITLLV
ncbi:actin binding Rho activating protein b [Brachionichthys hirsutus]|uniref:actin binding Rho activating protein b n=1 Tax=Brachionichthys hirsutus TaxID=412623 RepID=UPI003604F9C6